MGLVPGTEIGPGPRLAGLGVAFLPSFALFLAGVLGGGDVMLLAALGALLGLPVGRLRVRPYRNGVCR